MEVKGADLLGHDFDLDVAVVALIDVVTHFDQRFVKGASCLHCQVGLLFLEELVLPVVKLARKVHCQGVGAIVENHCHGYLLL